MKIYANKLIITLIVIFISGQFCFSEKSSRDSVEITYIANEGFLIKVNDKRILIDALFGDKEYEFCDNPDSYQLECMMNAKEDFENIDLIAATHCHIDHFYNSFVVAHLANNKSGKFISTRQAVDLIKKADNYNENISTQLVEITPDTLTSCDTTINEIGIRVYRLIHGPYYVYDTLSGTRINRHQNIQNLGFLFNINGIKIFHCGDSDPSCISDYKSFHLDKEKIDIAFIGSDFMSAPECEGIDILRDYINPKHIILMHIQHDQNKKFIDVSEQLKDKFPRVMIFEKKRELKSIKFE